jgi:ankyrin repeat protein
VDLTTTLALGTVEQVAAAIARDPAAVNQPGQTDDGRLPLHWAASRKSPEMVKLLLDHGADPNGREKDGNPPLTTAVFAGEPKVVAALIAAKADVNPRGQGDTTPLYWACTRLDVDVINLLLAAGANPNTSDPKQPQPLSAVLQSVREGRFGEQASPEERRAKARVILAALLDHKADVNGKMWGGGYSPLFSADEDLAEFLVAHGAKTDVVTDDGNSLLHYAAMTSRADLARFALKHNLPLEARNKKGETPLLCAVGYFNPRNGVLDLLLAKSPDLTATDADGRSPLHRAAQIGSVAAVTALLDRQADPQAKDSEGATPLHLAAKAAHDDLIPLLVTRGAPVNATDKSGRTPLDYATKPETRKVLTTHGATGG